MGKILDINGDMIETHHYDADTGRSIIETTQDVEPYLKQIEDEKKETVSGWKGDLHKVATIPLVLIEQWNQELKCNVLAKENRHLLMLKINDRNYQKLRTKEGRV